MLKSIIRFLLDGTGTQFESYYLRVLNTSGAETAPSAAEARADYRRRIERLQWCCQ